MEADEAAVAVVAAEAVVAEGITMGMGIIPITMDTGDIEAGMGGGNPRGMRTHHTAM